MKTTIKNKYIALQATKKNILTYKNYFQKLRLKQH